MSIGDNIRSARINKRLTQSELASLLQKNGIDIGNTTISNWENGTSKPDPDTIEEICKILDVDGNYILGFSKAENEEKNFSELDLLFSKHKDKLTEGDEAIIKAIIEQRMKEIDKELDGDE